MQETLSTVFRKPQSHMKPLFTSSTSSCTQWPIAMVRLSLNQTPYRHGRYSHQVRSMLIIQKTQGTTNHNY